MQERRSLAPVLVGVALMLIAVAASAAGPHAGMLRHPDVSETRIVFRYANDIWTVSREGGVALPLASPVGNDGHAVVFANWFRQ